MARALDSILSELNNVYNPQRDVIRQQQEAIDPALQAEEKGLNFAKNDAFQQITDQANRRGLFYSGIPVAEEQKYTGGTFLPALANLRSKYQQQRFNLSDALNKIQAEQYNQAYGIHQKEVTAEEEARRWNEQLAASSRAAGAGMASPSFGGGNGSVLGANGGFGMGRKKDGGFAFTDANGNPISAAVYSAATGIPFRTLLQSMANAGDSGALQALQFVGNDYGYDPNKVAMGPYKNSGQSIYNALTWGLTPQAKATAKQATGGGSPFVNNAAANFARSGLR